uniref:Secreted protein n=1 Tax=Brugia timori TaxID=42155 RepID=A0A0R3QFI9_9BILA
LISILSLLLSSLSECTNEGDIDTESSRPSPFVVQLRSSGESSDFFEEPFVLDTSPSKSSFANAVIVGTSSASGNKSTSIDVLLACSG